MGIQSIPKPKGPEPKARCPRCKRPVAMMARGACVYCGVTLGTGGDPASAGAGPAMPPELIIAFDPSLRAKRGGGDKWLIRVLALTIVGFVIGIIAWLSQSR